MPRHRTLQAMLDWGHDLLTELERVVLHRLAIFAGGFMLQAAQEVAADDTIAAPMVVDCIANPIAKPLLITDTSGGAMVRRMHSRSSCKAARSTWRRDAMPHTIWSFLKTPRRRRGRGQSTNGWQKSGQAPARTN